MRPVCGSLEWEDSPAGLGTGSLDYSIGETLASRTSLQEKWDDMEMRLVERIAKHLDYRLLVIPSSPVRLGQVLCSLGPRRFLLI